MKAMLGIGLVCSLAWSMHAQAASFICDKAKTTTEHAICEYRQINDADVKMATTYSILKRLVPMGTRGMIQDEQVKWLSLRDRCGASQSCLMDVYKMRQQQLELHLDRINRQGPF